MNNNFCKFQKEIIFIQHLSGCLEKWGPAQQNKEKLEEIKNASEEALKLMQEIKPEASPT